MPTELKLFCRWCDCWHDTESEIKECKAKQETFLKRYSRKTKEEFPDDEKVTKLESEIAELKAMIAKLVKDKK